MKSPRLLVTLLLLGGCGTDGTPPRAQNQPVAPAASAPASPPSDVAKTSADGSSADGSSDDIRVSILSYDGIMELIASKRGKVVVMDAWSTSCVPCLKEFHNLVEIHKQYGPEQVACVSLSFDFEGIGTPVEQQGPVIKFLREQGATFDNLMSNEESDVLYKKLDLGAVPAVFVYDRAGKLRKRFDNQKAKSKAEQFTYEQVRELVAELVKEPVG